MKTILITGASSGIGKKTALLFLNNGWNVIATMRNPDAERELSAFRNALILKCDVTDHLSIKNAVSTGISHFGKIDVLVNNAGYYALGPLESATPEQIRRQIDTNLNGVIAMTQAVIPFFRKQRSGIIINISSIAGVITLPLQSLYHATKWGVEGFSESLQYELRPYHIRIKLIEPGVIKTDFYGRSMSLLQNDELTDYTTYSQRVIENIQKNGNKGSSPDVVAQTIFKAATDHKKKMRYSAGNSKDLIKLRKLLPNSVFRFIVQKVMEN